MQFQSYFGGFDGSCLFVGQQCNDGLVGTLNDVVTENCQCEGDGAVYGCTDPAACNFDAQANIDDGSCAGVFDTDLPWLGLELVQEHTDGPLTGMSTYRLYVNTPNEDDMLVSCIGDEDLPLILESTASPAWFQHPNMTSAFATEVNPLFYAAFPELRYDSWLTIGAEDNTAEVDIISIDDPTYEAFTAFEEGESIAVTGEVGSGWFVLPIPTNVEAIAGADKKVLIAQLTTAGEVSGQIAVQVFLNGDNENQFRELLPINVVGPLEGCTDPEACNYDSGVCDDDGSCDYSCLGCTDVEAANFDATATLDDGSCLYFVTSCDYVGQPNWEDYAQGIYSDTMLWHFFGESSTGSWVLHLPQIVTEPASNTDFAVLEWSSLTLSNMPTGLVANDVPASMGPGEQACISYEGVPTEVGLFDVVVSGELIVSLFGSPLEIGVVDVVGQIEILENPNPILGCIYGNAMNYLSYATQDDGSCVFEGCMDVDADNYDAFATSDDGTCVYGECESGCPGDVDGDGSVNVSDLLYLLGEFAITCEQ